MRVVLHWRNVLTHTHSTECGVANSGSSGLQGRLKNPCKQRECAVYRMNCPVLPYSLWERSQQDPLIWRLEVLRRPGQNWSHPNCLQNVAHSMPQRNPVGWRSEWVTDGWGQRRRQLRNRGLRQKAQVWWRFGGSPLVGHDHSNVEREFAMFPSNVNVPILTQGRPSGAAEEKGRANKAQ